MNILEYLNYLKEKEYLIDYSIDYEEKGVILTYGLFSVGSTELYIDYDFKELGYDDLVRFLNTMLINSTEISTNIYSCLVDDNDFYGYDSLEELDNRIDEEESFIKKLVSIGKDLI